MEGGIESGNNWLLNRCDDGEADRKTNVTPRFLPCVSRIVVVPSTMRTNEQR